MKKNQIRVADFIADFIAKKGINDIFMLPGGGAMYLVDAFGNHKDLDFVAMHHEQSVSIASESYSRITQNFGVGLVTTGPGSTNAITGVVGAWIESVPMMIISGQVKRADLIGDRDIRQSGVQEVDIISMVKNHTKYAITIDEPQNIKYHLQKAYYEMMNSRKGPVWIDVPLDIQGATIDINTLKEFKAPLIQKQEVELDDLIRLINTSKRPLILAGHGIRLANANEEFRDLIKRLQIPVVTTWNATDLVEYDNELFAGKTGVVTLRNANFTIQNCDLLISIGSRLDNIITAYNPSNFAKNAKKVMVDIDINEINNSKIDFELTFATDAKDFINSLIENRDKIKINTKEWLEKCKTLKEKYCVENEFDFTKLEGFSHFEFANELSKNLKGGEIISTGSSGLGLEALYVAFQIKKNQRIFLTSGLGAMGYGLPSAIGTCVANNRQKIIAVESDGSLQLNIQEFAVLKGQKLPIMLFIMDNNGYASIRNTQKNYFDARYVATGEEGNLYLPSISSICDAYGIRNSTITNAEELKSIIKEYDNLNEPFVVITKLLKDETLQPKCSAMPQKDGSMISMPLEDMAPLLSIEDLKENLISEVDEISYKVRGL
jgi:acetolactate synthase-1/2/3 large subunit